jgi:hypothetical protein
MRHNPYFFGRRSLQTATILQTATADEFYYAQNKPHARLTPTAVQHDICVISG